MVTGNKILFVCVLFFSVVHILCAQNITCYRSGEYPNEVELLTVIEDYLLEDPSTNIILLVDFYKLDTINLYRIVGSGEIFEIFFKNPDCYFMYKDNIVYLFTDNYKQQKDSIWSEKVFSKTKEILNYPIISVLWKYDSIVEIEGPFSDYGQYDPVVIEYRVNKGKIITKSICEKMLYPDTGTPKGVRTFRYFKVEKVRNPIIMW